MWVLLAVVVDMSIVVGREAGVVVDDDAMVERVRARENVKRVKKVEKVK